MLDVPDGKGVTALEEFKVCLVGCQSQSYELMFKQSFSSLNKTFYISPFWSRISIYKVKEDFFILFYRTLTHQVFSFIQDKLRQQTYNGLLLQKKEICNQSYGGE